MGAKKENYRVIKHFMPGSNIVKLVLLGGLKGKVLIWRPLNGHRGNGDVLYEILAYKISNLLGLDVIAKAWRGALNGVPGVLQDFIDGVDGYTWDDISRHNMQQTEDYCRILILDYLIGNRDRFPWHLIHVPGNGVGRLWSVDHTNIFNYDSSDIHRLRAGLSSSGGVVALHRVREYVKKLRVSGKVDKLSAQMSDDVGALITSEFLRRLNVIKDGLKE